VADAERQALDRHRNIEELMVIGTAMDGSRRKAVPEAAIGNT
jgi:hypothetical protein